jgi:hypothetical protein
MKHLLALETIMPGVTDQQFYQEMQKLRDLIDYRANGIERKLDEHAAEDRAGFTAIGNRVLTIEIQRDEEKSQAIKRGSLLALIGASGMTLGIAAIRKFFNI